MIHEVKMYGAKCDHCGEEWQDDHNGWVAVIDELSMKQILGDEGWYTDVDGKSHYCTECFDYDENDVFYLKPERKQSC